MWSHLSNIRRRRSSSAYCFSRCNLSQAPMISTLSFINHLVSSFLGINPSYNAYLLYLVTAASSHLRLLLCFLRLVIILVDIWQWLIRPPAMPPTRWVSLAVPASLIHQWDVWTLLPIIRREKYHTLTRDRYSAKAYSILTFQKSGAETTYKGTNGDGMSFHESNIESFKESQDDELRFNDRALYSYKSNPSRSFILHVSPDHSFSPLSYIQMPGFEPLLLSLDLLAGPQSLTSVVYQVYKLLSFSEFKPALAFHLAFGLSYTFQYRLPKRRFGHYTGWS